MRHDRLFVHLVWTTRFRAAIITAPVADFLAVFLQRVTIQERATLLECGIVTTHLHLLLRLDPTTAIPRLVQRFKGGSAAIAEKEGISERPNPLRWAKGYSISSVSEQAVPRVIQYIREQPRHHPEEAIPGWSLAADRFTDTHAEPRL